jgi:hypothetical protein
MTINVVTSNTVSIFLVLVCVQSLWLVHSWSLHNIGNHPPSHQRNTNHHCSSRRSWLQQQLVVIGGGIASVVLAPVESVEAVSGLPSPTELERIRKGHSRVRFLLDHWDDITQVCGTTVRSNLERKQVVRTEGGGGTEGCEKTPLEVQQYMGYKSTEDPLYKVEKLLVRAAPLVDDPESYLGVVEAYKEKADYTAMMVGY